jgi:RNA polymerase sigma-70 factor (ECF subfamily)
MDPTKPSDSEIYSKLTGRDEEAWRLFYRAHQGRIYRYSMQMSRSIAIAEEVTQDTFVTFLSEIGRYDPARGPLELWLLGIARNKVLKCLGALRRNTELADLSSAENLTLDAERRQEQATVRAAIQSLPEAYREAIVLCDLQQLSYAEAATVLQCPVGTVRSRLCRGRQILCEKLSCVGAAP